MSMAFELSDNETDKLREKAESLGIPPQKLLEAGIEDFLNQPDEEFTETLKDVLDKNDELYDRLS
jgi:hypothetical protein